MVWSPQPSAIHDLLVGDGQETAFYHSNAVFTLSFHILEKGFFPGEQPLHVVRLESSRASVGVSGGEVATGEGRGQGFNRNVPVKRATKGSEYVHLFKATISPILTEFNPEAIVVVCGADSLKGDPRGGLELTPADMWECVQILRDCGRPLLVLGKLHAIGQVLLITSSLGGGGYKFTAVSRCWTLITSKLLGEDLSGKEIPEHEFFEFYGPSWTL